MQQFPAVEIKLFGATQVFVGGKPLDLARRQPLALLAILALAEGPIERDTLALMLWPDVDQSTARRNIRRALSRLRTTLREHNADQILLTRGQNQVLLDHAECAVDVVTFRRLAEQRDLAQDHTEAVEHAAAMLPLYSAPLLDGFHLTDSPEFEQWLLLEREQTDHLYREALGTLVQAHRHALGEDERHQALTTSITAAKRLLAMDSLDEHVHRTLMALYAEVGQRDAAIRQFEECESVLQRELDVPPDAETVTLYNQIQSGDFPPTRAAPTPRQTLHNLPADATPFVGRRRELDQISKQLADPHCRLLTLVGLGGMGKTRLGLESARCLLADSDVAENCYPDGIWFVSLVGSNSLTQAIVEVLNLQFKGDELETQLAEYLADRAMLLVLDNCEHLIDQAVWLGTLLAKAEKVSILATARRPLHLQEEWLFEVWGLAHPLQSGKEGGAEEEEEGSGEGAEETDGALLDAISLFAQAAKRVDPSFAPTDENRADILRICQLVGGHALSIELAAAWVRLLSCSEICVEIAKSMELFSSNKQNVPERHRSIQAVFDHTWRSLDEVGQESMRRLSVFCGGFDRHAATHITNTSLVVLLQLVENSLVQRRGELFELHPAIRQYAAEKLAEERTKVDVIYGEHCRYHIAFLDEQIVHRRSTEQPSAQRKVAARLDDIHQAWRWALEQRWEDEVARAMVPLHGFYEVRGWYGMGIRHFAFALNCFASDSIDIGRGKRGSLVAGLRTRLAALQVRLGRLKEAQKILAETVSYFNAVGGKFEEAVARYWLGNALHNLGEYSKSEGEFRRALGISEGIDSDLEQAQNLRELADLAFYAHGNTDEAQHFYTESLVAAKRADDLMTQAKALLNHGGLLVGVGDLVQGKEMLLESLRIFQSLNAKRLIGVALNNLAIIEDADGDHAAAQALDDENYAIRLEIGDKLGQANCLRNMAQRAGLLLDFEKARTLGMRAKQSYEEMDYQRGIVFGCNVLTVAEARLQQIDAARQMQSEAIVHCRMLGSMPVWTGTMLSAIHLAIASKRFGIALLLAGQVRGNLAAHSYIREDAQSLLDEIRMEWSEGLALLDVDGLLAEGHGAELETVIGWLEELLS